MKIQALATLFTAAAVALFQAPEPEKANAPAEAAKSPRESLPSSFVWEPEVHDSEQPGVFQNQASDLTDEPDPFSIEISGGGFSAGPPEEVPSSVEPVIEYLADNGDPLEEEIIDLTGGPDFVDVPDPTPVSALDAVSSPNESLDLEVAIDELTGTPVSVEATSPVSVEADPAVQAGSENPLDEIQPTPPLAEASPTASLANANADAPLAGIDSDAVEVQAGIAWEVSETDPNAEIASAPSTVPTDVSGLSVQVDSAPGVGIAESQIVSGITSALEAGAPSETATGEGEDGEQTQPTMGAEDGGGFWLRGAKLNDVFQYLARSAGMQYFHNIDLDAENFIVTGHLRNGDPIAQMEELGLMYGVTVYEKGSTVYALSSSQLAQLPTRPYQYKLAYLRPGDIEQIKTILQPVLTPGSGTVDFEPKTNTLIIIDNEQKIQDLRDILLELDQPKEQIAIETRILRITSSSRNQVGVDWETVLGDGLTFEGEDALNALFNLPDSDMITEVVTRTANRVGSGAFTIAERGEHPEFGPITGTDEFEIDGEWEQEVERTGSHLVLSPLQLEATLRALNTGGLAQQESSPTLITEDNEPGIISIIDRLPIITTVVTQTDVGQNITEEVRYRIDLDDPVDDPTTTREIGVSVAVTPTILPDNTIRMALRPRSAQIVDFLEGQTGNLYPRVNESTVDTIARVPNGHSLLIGGFYEESQQDGTKKVPILGDVPIVNFLFKATDDKKDMTSLVFVVTPKYYSPVSIPESDRMTRELHDRHVLPPDHNWPDRQNPGFNYEPNMGWAVGNALNLYPDTEPNNPLHPEHPVNDQMYSEIPPGAAPARVEATDTQPATRERRGLFGGLFKRNQR